jgi:hypothetical protein
MDRTVVWIGSRATTPAIAYAHELEPRRRLPLPTHGSLIPCRRRRCLPPSVTFTACHCVSPAIHNTPPPHSTMMTRTDTRRQNHIQCRGHHASTGRRGGEIVAGGGQRGDTRRGEQHVEVMCAGAWRARFRRQTWWSARSRRQTCTGRCTPTSLSRYTDYSSWLDSFGYDRTAQRYHQITVLPRSGGDCRHLAVRREFRAKRVDEKDQLPPGTTCRLCRASNHLSIFPSYSKPSIFLLHLPSRSARKDQGYKITLYLIHVSTVTVF